MVSKLTIQRIGDGILSVAFSDLVIESLLDFLEEVNAVALGEVGFCQTDEGVRRVIEEIVGEPRVQEVWNHLLLRHEGFESWGQFISLKDLDGQLGVVTGR